MKTILFLAAILCVIGCSSEGPAGPTGKDGLVGPAGKDGTQDKQIIYRIYEPVSFGQCSLDNPRLALALLQFDIRNYVGVDSIVLCAMPWVEFTDNAPDTYAVMEMFDMTNHVSIAHSAINTSRKGEFDKSMLEEDKYLRSENFYKYLPQQSISLGILLRSNSKNCYASAYPNYYLILYRK